MARIRTLDDLQNALDKEMGWRVKEVKAFSIAAKRGGQVQKFFIRAGITLLYAHWEGFIKAASKCYLRFVNNQNRTYRDLKTCFAILGLKNQLNMLSYSRKSEANIVAFDFIISHLDQRLNMNMSSAIDTESNLSSKVFANIATSLDIDIDNYKTKFNLIDQSLVLRRNRVAHGRYLDLDGKEFRDIVEEILQLMRNYKTDLEDAASMKSYNRP